MRFGEERRRRGISVGTLLLLVVALPVSGGTRFVYEDVRQARDARDTVSDVQSTVDDALMLFDLRTNLLREQSWQLNTSGLLALGIPSSVVKNFSDIDFDAELARARRDVDDVLDSLPDPELRTAILEQRPSDTASLDDVISVYNTMADDVSALVEQRVITLLAAAARSTDADDLSNAVQVLAATSDAEATFSAGVTNYFGARFSYLFEGEPVDSSRSLLLSTSVRYELALSQISRLETSGRFDELLTQLTMSPSYQGFREASNQVIDDVITGELTSSGSADLLAEFGTASPVFDWSSELVEAHETLLGAAVDEVRQAADDQAAAANQSMYRTLASAGALLVLTALIAVLAGRLIVKPVRRLAAGAERIEDGELDRTIPLHGPREIRDATRALNNTAATLTLVEQQARQMAESGLHPDDVTQVTPGPLGDPVRSAMEALAATITERERLRAELAYEASHDGLTGIQNRNSVLERLDEAVARVSRSEEGLAVMFLDLDGFKAVNDELGHATGDLVLRTVAHRLQQTIRKTDHLGRIGGDEFLLVAEFIESERQVAAFGRRVVDIVSQPIETSTGSVAVGVSVGIDVCWGIGADAEVLLARADAAVYAAKARGRNRVVVHPTSGAVEPENRSDDESPNQSNGLTGADQASSTVVRTVPARS